MKLDIASNSTMMPSSQDLTVSSYIKSKRLELFSTKNWEDSKRDNSSRIFINNTSLIIEDENINDVYSLSQDIMLYSLLIIIPLGLICNSLSVTVFLNMRMRKRATSWYLAALGVSDNVSLMTVLFDYCLKHPHIGLDIVKHSYVVCVLITHLSYTSRLMSALLVTTFTVERFIGVIYPLKRAGFSCTFYVRKVIAIEGLLCFLCTSFIVFTVGIVDLPYGNECDVLPGSARVYFILTVIMLIFGSIIIPIVIICTLNVYILSKIYTKQKHFIQRRVSFSNDKPIQYRKKNDYNIATLLLVVSMAFVILNLPYCITWVLLFAQYYGLVGFSGIYPQWHLFAAKYLTSVPYYLNYVINFILYNLCAKMFRVELVRVLLCARYTKYKKKPPPCA